MPAEIDAVLLEAISHEQFVADVRALAAALAAAGWRPDLLVGVARGGLAPAVYLSHLIDAPMRSLTIGDADEVARLAARSRASERLLILDDINDSGGTFGALAALLDAAGADRRQLRTAALIDNIRSIAPVDFSARRIDRAIDKRWFVFPWEAMADRTMLVADAIAVPERLG